MKNFLSVIIIAFLVAFSANCEADKINLTDLDRIFADSYDLSEMTTGYDAEGIVDPDIDFLALRTGPSVDYPLIARIPPGARVRVSSGRGGWNGTYWGKSFVEVTYKGMSGYAHSKYIAIIPKTIKNYP